MYIFGYDKHPCSTILKGQPNIYNIDLDLGRCQSNISNIEGVSSRHICYIIVMSNNSSLIPSLPFFSFQWHA